MHWLEYAVFVLIVAAVARPVGRHLAAVFEGKRAFGEPVFRPVETALFRLLSLRNAREMSAPVYVACFIAFTLAGAGFLFVLLMLQSRLPGGPADEYHKTQMTTDLAANTAVSFATTTTWQAYAGESTLRYLTQVIGLVSQNFLGGAAGLAAGIAFIRGFARQHTPTIGNFWVDVVRALVWVLLPLSILGSIVLLIEGVPMTFAPYAVAQTVEGKPQVIALGPVAALEFIKNLGTNGGGFFNANGAHPFANPTPLTNFLGMLAIAVIPAALPITFGEMTGRPRAGWLLFGVMLVLFVAGLVVCDRAEAASPRQLRGLNLSGGNLEGKETRFGISGSVLTAVVTSNGATGSNNSMNDSYQPVGVLVMLLNLFLGEVIFGGLGTGLSGLVMTALVAVFLGGLMVGRTPEYLGKTIRIPEAQLVALNALLTHVVVMSLTGIAAATAAGKAGLTTNGGPRGLTEMLFAYASCMANNGQSLGGLNANTPFYNLTTILAMVAGRLGPVALALILAGRFAAQGQKPTTPGTLPCDTITFGVLVLTSVLLIGALCFLPAIALGPVADHLQPVLGK